MGALEPIQDNLVPVFEVEIDGVIQPAVNARELHAFLKVKRDFSNWIKGRIRKYDFVENQDFVVFAKIGENLNGGRPSIEYAITLDMAKELSMVENNEQGKKARRYFIKCEKVLMQVNNNLMMQFNRALLEFEKFSDLASRAGRTLNYVGKQLKPQSKIKLDDLSKRLQPMLNLFEPENEKADCTRQSKQSALTKTNHEEGI